MNLILSIIEIACFIVLPLIIFYQRSKWKYQLYIFILPLLYLAWYLTYGFLHEFAHLLGVWICGKEIFDYQLITHFWKGQFGSGYVRYNFQGDKSDFFIIVLPYLRDLIFLIIGYFVINKYKPKNPFVTGLILILLIFSPLYDVANNYIAWLTGYKNDFNALKVSSSTFISNLTGIILSLLSFFVAGKIIFTNKGYPD